jgi:hypothetical protein
VLPTEARVEKMLAGTSHDRDEIVGRLRPTAYREAWEFSVEKVAVNAVMAGADPAYFPVILAIAASGFTARGSSTSSQGNLVVVNGPIRREIGMNSGLGALGPYSHANATIGRAFGLLSQNLQGGSVPGETYMGSQGNAFSYNNNTFAENEEASPWEPHHVQQGFAPEESTVTVFSCWSKLWTEGLRGAWEDKLQAMLGGQDGFLGTTLVFDPIVARELVSLGFDTKQKLCDWVQQNVRISARRDWSTYSAKTFIREDVEAGVEPYATYAKADPDDLLPLFQPHQVNVFVAGGSSNGQWSAYNAQPMDPRFRQPNDKVTSSVDVWR